nr:heavy-metal-associated domain-containing protein [Allomuricauda sp.]
MQTSIAIQNLKCGGCAATITDELLKIEKVTNVEVIQEKDTVLFRHDNQEQRNLVEKKLKDLGYPPMEDENGLMLKAKSFVSCARGRISKI